MAVAEGRVLVSLADDQVRNQRIVAAASGRVCAPAPTDNEANSSDVPQIFASRCARSAVVVFIGVPLPIFCKFDVTSIAACKAPQRVNAANVPLSLRSRLPGAQMRQRAVERIARTNHKMGCINFRLKSPLY